MSKKSQETQPNKKAAALPPGAPKQKKLSRFAGASSAPLPIDKERRVADQQAAAAATRKSNGSDQRFLAALGIEGGSPVDGGEKQGCKTP